MEGERRKRKLQIEGANEEEKMEKFFALIRSAKDVRDRLSKEKESDKLEQDKPKVDASVWNPTFQPQDFLDFPDLSSKNARSSTPAAASSNQQPAADNDKEAIETAKATVVPVPAPAADDQDKEIKGTDDDLDLGLSL